MQRDQIRKVSFEILVTALLWVALFNINEWLFQATSFSEHINWVFLPAALRMVSVLLLGVSGSIGLILGAFITSDTAGSIIDALVLATLSGLCPYISVVLCNRLFKLPQDLGGLTSKQLLGFAFAGGFTSVIAHHLYFYSRNHVSHLFEGAIPMLVGDILGALLFLYVAKLAIRLIDKIQASNTQPT